MCCCITKYSKTWYHKITHLLSYSFCGSRISVALLGSLVQGLPQSCSHFNVLLGRDHFLTYLVVVGLRPQFFKSCQPQTSLSSLSYMPLHRASHNMAAFLIIASKWVSKMEVTVFWNHRSNISSFAVF